MTWPSFEAWRKDAEKKAPKLLQLTRDQLMRHDAAGHHHRPLPGQPRSAGQKLKLAYLHEPGEADDGVTLTVPLAMLNQVPANRCEWLVPGLLEEKVTALLRTVPQKHRHRLQPMADSAADFMAQLRGRRVRPGRAAHQGAAALRRGAGVLKLPMESFRPENLNPHCFMNFRVQDEHGRILGQSRNLAELRTQLQATRWPRASSRPASCRPPTRRRRRRAPAQAARKAAAPARPAPPGRSAGFTGWSFGPLPELLEVKVAGREIVGFPALHDDGGSVSLRPYDTPEEAAKVHRGGLARLFALELSAQVKAIEKLPGIRELALQFIGYGNEAELKAQLVTATLERCCLLEPLPGRCRQPSQALPGGQAAHHPGGPGADAPRPAS